MLPTTTNQTPDRPSLNELSNEHLGVKIVLNTNRPIHLLIVDPDGEADPDSALMRAIVEHLGH